MRFVSLLIVTGVLFLAASAIAAEPVLAQYRGVTLGDSVQVVADRLQLPAASVRVITAGSAAVQELTWRPQAGRIGNDAADSVGAMVLTFLDGRLARIAVTYDRMRIQGLTDADLNEAMVGVYGPSLLIATATTPALGSISERMTIGRWQDADTLLVLWREHYPNLAGLTITSLTGDAALEDAIAEGARRDAADAPARELARRNAERAAIEARDEKIRIENKAKFKPQ